MDTKDTIYAALMVVSAFVLTYEWLDYLDNRNPVIYVSAMVLVAALAAMILGADARLRRIESEIEAKERSLRINIQGMEENVDRKLDAMTNETRASIKEITGRLYR
uniref:Uncharacterized protein n=1 Tax=Candidatus Methanogaster sp. ANME-2c ERB4 TaxID=2759911 RepID=A0A7G9YHB6_9EURY|nr:hypothetical protein FLPANLNF_00019 [Methanosarcinales archaeon ANME-2c ERB4]